MLLSKLSSNRWLSALLVVLLLVAGAYLAFSWFFAYLWGGVRNEGAAQNIVTILIGVFFAFIWLGFLLAKKSVLMFWISFLFACLVSIVLVWDNLQQLTLSLNVAPIHIVFALIALVLLLVRRAGSSHT